jgi:hypothetical protein
MPLSFASFAKEGSSRLRTGHVLIMAHLLRRAWRRMPRAMGAFFVAPPLAMCLVPANSKSCCESSAEVIPWGNKEAIALNTEELEVLERMAEIQLPSDPWYIKDRAWMINFFMYWGSVLGEDNVLEKYRQVLEWRRSSGVNDLLDQKKYQPAKEVDDVLKVGVHPLLARNNGVIYYERYGSIDPARLVAMDDDAGFMYMIYQCERFFSMSMGLRQQHPDCASATVLVDLNGLSWSHLTSGATARIISWTQKKQKYYCHTPGQKVYVCGVSNVVMWVWDITKTWVTKPVAESVVFVPTDCMPVLLEKISPESMPEWCYEMSPELVEAAAALRAEGQTMTLGEQRAEWCARLEQHRETERKSKGNGGTQLSLEQQRSINAEKAQLKSLVRNTRQQGQL